jgi:hypothetical protein
VRRVPLVDAGGHVRGAEGRGDGGRGRGGGGGSWWWERGGCVWPLTQGVKCLHSYIYVSAPPAEKGGAQSSRAHPIRRSFREEAWLGYVQVPGA